MGRVQLDPFGLEDPKPEPQNHDKDSCLNPVYPNYGIAASLGIDLIEAIVEEYFDETKHKGDHIEYHEHNILRRYVVGIANLVSGLLSDIFENVKFGSRKHDAGKRMALIFLF